MNASSSIARLRPRGVSLLERLVSANVWRVWTIHGWAIGVCLGVLVATASVKPADAQQRSEVEELRQRIEQLEAQIVDLQVVIGTLQSLAGGAVRPGGGLSGDDAFRLQAVETQLQAISGQIAALTSEVRGGSQATYDGQSSSGGQGAVGFSTEIAPANRGVAGGFDGGYGTGSTSVGDVSAGTLQPLPSLDGATGSDPIGRILAPGAGSEALASGLAVTGQTPEQVYERAYGFLLQQDYGAAQTAFTEFVDRFPEDKLAGNAQFWLGETHYVRGSYREAAGAFLKAYKTYGESTKAPDSLLKLAMSLSRLGQKPAACSTFQEFEARFPEAAGQNRRRVAEEQNRAGC
ncbi:MAG: tol-pal system protein YbgF [Rhizobiales bacterium]|nr:tol-pal system protein YbgF [Hyphomicrobiales bacterium]